MRKYKEKTITAHCIVKNEENWVWYALSSVKDFVDKILVFDTGSTDKTVKIIKTIKSPKILFEEKGEVGLSRFTDLRNEQLVRTKTDWVLLLDGDEIWPKNAILALKKAINRASAEKEAVIVRYWDCVGDIYHHLAATQKLKYPYAPAGKIGWMTIRALKRSIPGLKCVRPYGQEGFEDKEGKSIQARGKNRLIFLNEYYLHTSYLPRSSKDEEVILRSSKRKFELGEAFPRNFQYPEVFNLQRPNIVPSPWQKAPINFWLKAAAFTPYLRARRYFWQKIFYPDFNLRYQRPKIFDFFFRKFQQSKRL